MQRAGRVGFAWLPVACAPRTPAACPGVASPCRGPCVSPIAAPESLVAVAARVPDAQVIGHQQDEVRL